MNENNEMKFNRACRLLVHFERHGYEAYIVGGAVRDYLLKKNVDDIDIATSATPIEVQGMFVKTLPVGIEHGTVIVRFEHVSFEVTTFRTESGYADFRHPDQVSFVRDIKEDLKRRDFTINAMAMGKAGDIIDPYGGQNDLRGRLIRTVGKPDDRFGEDPLRMLRAIRFAGKLNFKIHEETLIALGLMRDLMNEIAVERIEQEFTKLLIAPFTAAGIKALLTTKLYENLPCLEEADSGIRNFGTLELEMLTTKLSAWAAFMRAIDIEQPEHFFKAWRFSNKMKNDCLKTSVFCDRVLSEEVIGLKNVYTSGLDIALEGSRVLAAYGFRGFDRLKAEAEETYTSLPIKKRSDLKATGHDLMAWTGRSPGPWISETLSMIESAVLDGRIQNSPEAIQKQVVECHS